MEQYISYINQVLPDKHGDSTLYRFKKKILDEMTQRANEVASHGLTDRKVIDDLIISEYADLDAQYQAYSKKEYEAKHLRKRVLGNVIGSLIYILATVTVFLGVSMMTHAWAQTWVIVVDGILLWVVYLLSLGVNKLISMKKIFHIFARILLFGAVVVATVAAFLLVVALTDLPHSWLMVMAGLAAAFISDGIFATVTKSRFAIFYWLLYVPVIATFLFIIVGVLQLLPWGIAWMMIPLSLILDLVIILAAIGKNKHDKTEVYDSWSEN